MKRVVIGLITALSLALGAGVAYADGPGDWGHWGDGGGGQQSSSTVVAVAGVVTSVDQSTSSFTANAFVPSGEGRDQGDQAGANDNDGQNGGQGSEDQGDQGSSGQGSSQQGGSQQGGSQQGGSQNGGFQGDFHRQWLGGGQGSMTAVTITTDGSTTFKIDGQDGALTGLAQGDRFVALFNGSPTDSLQTLVSSPPVAVFAHTAPTERQLYAFVGMVTGTDTTMGTVTVQVSNSLPSGLVPAGSSPSTFTVSPSTMILGGSAMNGLFGGALTDVKAGDLVAGGLIGPAGESLSQVESSPLQVLVDFPASAAPAKTAAMRRMMRQRALTQTMALFGFRAHSKHHRAHRKSHAHHGRAGVHRARTHARRA